MNKGLFRKVLPHLIAVVVFLLVAVIYCRPVLQGSVLSQSDVTQWKGMSKGLFDYKATHGHFPLWSNTMFSGMPAYQIAMEADNPVSPGIIYHILSLGLPKPISFFFLACICFYIFSQIIRVNPYVGIIGGLAFAYVTYNIGIIEAGHDTKMQTIAFMPAFIGSLILLYDKKYLWGGALTALFTSLLIAMNHMQITYYTLIIAGFMTVAYVINWIRSGQIKHLALSLGIVVVAGALGVLSNAVTIFTTLEASKTTIRGGTEIADKNSSKTGLSKDYALSYSMYKAEPLVMFSPNLFGGSGDVIENKVENSKAVEVLQSMPQEMASQLAGYRAAYWGGLSAPGQVPPNAPPYVGAIICFLTLVGFAILDNKHKWWILGASVLAFMMAWGSYFDGFNTFLLNSLPGYNKFRVPSMALVIPTFLFCMMAIMTIQKIIETNDKASLLKEYKKGLLISAGLVVVALLIYMSSDFAAGSDTELSKQVSSLPAQVQEYVRNFLNALKDDRKSLFFSSLIRSLLFAGAAAAVLWLRVRNTIGNAVALSLVGILAFADIITVDTKYLNAESYVDATDYNNQSFFTPTAADQQILQDKGYYRVFDLRQGLGTLTQGAGTAYFHNSIGGYHPAKLSIYQDLIEHQLSNFPASLPILNMLNTKYIIQADQSGKESIYPNEQNLGAAWFVNAVRFENTPQDVMNALSNFHPKDTAIVFAADKAAVNFTPTNDSSSIQLIKNDNDVITYRYTSPVNRFAVFSEIYYKPGWKATVDGKELPIVRTNYVLRGLSLPAGQNKEIRFEFHPSSFYSGKTLSFISGLVILLALLAALIAAFRNRQKME